MRMRSIPVVLALAAVSGIGCGGGASPESAEAPAAVRKEPSAVSQAPRSPSDSQSQGDDAIELGNAPLMEDPLPSPLVGQGPDEAESGVAEPAQEEGGDHKKSGSNDVVPEADQTSQPDALSEPNTDAAEEGPALVPEQRPDHSAENVKLDNEHRWVVMKGKVVLREGPLELLVCLKNSKEHESILAVDAQAKYIHTQLLLAGAESGSPAQFVPEYHAATGQEIDIEFEWKDKDGKTKRAKAQEWVQDVRTKKQLKYPWVFAGSQITEDGYYLAESGDLICVVNFTSATLDLPVPSSETNDELLFQAFTERIPPVGTDVTIYLKPVKKQEEAKDDEANKGTQEEDTGP